MQLSVCCSAVLTAAHLPCRQWAAVGAQGVAPSAGRKEAARVVSIRPHQGGSPHAGSESRKVRCAWACGGEGGHCVLFAGVRSRPQKGWPWRMGLDCNPYLFLSNSRYPCPTLSTQR